MFQEDLGHSPTPTSRMRRQYEMRSVLSRRGVLNRKLGKLPVLSGHWQNQDESWTFVSSLLIPSASARDLRTLRFATMIGLAKGDSTDG